ITEEVIGTIVRALRIDVGIGTAAVLRPAGSPRQGTADHELRRERVVAVRLELMTAVVRQKAGRILRELPVIAGERRGHVDLTDVRVQLALEVAVVLRPGVVDASIPLAVERTFPEQVESHVLALELRELQEVLRQVDAVVLPVAVDIELVRVGLARIDEHVMNEEVGQTVDLILRVLRALRLRPLVDRTRIAEVIDRTPQSRVRELRAAVEDAELVEVELVFDTHCERVLIVRLETRRSEALS